MIANTQPTHSAERDRSVSEYYDRFSPTLVRDWVYGNRRVDAIRRFLKDALPGDTGSILEIGCGIGANAAFMARTFRQAHIDSIDLSAANIAVARQLFASERITFAQGDATTLDLGRQYEVVVMPDVYEHIPASARASLHSALASHLTPDGMVILTVPSELHQDMLHELGQGLQIIDETVTVDDLQRLARDLGATLTYFAMVSAHRANDYYHVVIERGADRVQSIGKKDRVPRRRADLRPRMIRGVDRRLVGAVRALWRKLRLKHLGLDIA